MKNNSPNWLWHQIGYEIERKYIDGILRERNIYRPDGSRVDFDTERDRHEAEIEAALREGAKLSEDKK